MTTVNIPCPACKRQLKLPSRDYLGKKGKCPGCQHRFILEEPAIELEFADPPVPTTDSEFPATNFPNIDTSQPTNISQGKRKKSGKRRQNPQTDATHEQAKISTNSAQTQISDEFDFSIKSDQPQTANIAEAVRSRRRRTTQTGPIIIGAGTALLVLLGVGIWWTNQSHPSGTQTTDTNSSIASSATTPTNTNPTNVDANGLLLAEDGGTSLSPSSGQPIDVEFLPFAPDFILHLKPAKLWSEDRHNMVFIKSVEPVAVWLRDHFITNVTGFQPADIKTLTIGMNFGPLTSEPDVAMKVELIKAETASQLQRDRLKARMSLDVQGVLENESWAFRIIDDKNFLVASSGVAEAFAQPTLFGGLPAVEMVSLLDQSDQDRPLTLMIDINKLDAHLEHKIPADLQSIAISFLTWLGNDVRMLSWSLQLEEELYMETVLINESSSSPKRLKKHLESQLSKLPVTLSQILERTQPRDFAEQKFVGRYPAMIQATLLGTQTSTGPNFARLVTLLPQKAAANLALGSYYSANLVNSTDFSVPVASNTPNALPKTLNGRLNLKMDAEFNRTPLQEAFAAVAEACSIEITINGDALKLSGMTQNMPQTFNLGQATGRQVLAQIQKNHPEIAFVADQNQRAVLVTTKSVAESTNQPIFTP